MEKGKFITLEGGEGSGKSTQAQAISHFLKEKNIPSLITREPGGSPGAELIRNLLVNGDVKRWDAITEALLLNAARRDHLISVIWPELNNGTWVICDRFADSTIAYQGFGHGMSFDTLEALYTLIAGSFEPDLTFVFDIDVRQGLALARARQDSADRYERMEIAFHERLREGYHMLTRQHPARYVKIDASLPRVNVTQAVLSELCQRLKI
ncbi:MAG: dTMP kinase [Alphaproteobacteria bacterium]|nr:dTMP kinase [Alphaproteobacteria bacterium]